MIKMPSSTPKLLQIELARQPELLLLLLHNPVKAIFMLLRLRNQLTTPKIVIKLMTVKKIWALETHPMTKIVNGEPTTQI
jgi:hypothetical protein